MDTNSLKPIVLDHRNIAFETAISDCFRKAPLGSEWNPGLGCSIGVPKYNPPGNGPDPKSGK